MRQMQNHANPCRDKKKAKYRREPPSRRTNGESKLARQGIVFHVKVKDGEKQNLKSTKNSVDTPGIPFKDSSVTLLPNKIDHDAQRHSSHTGCMATLLGVHPN